MVGIQKRGGGHDHAGCAVGALHGGFVEESLLQGMQVVANGEAFDRSDLVIPDEADLRAARTLGDSIDEDGAGAALAFAAAVLGAGEVELVAQDGEQGPLRFSINFADGAVYFYLRYFCHKKSGFEGEIW